MNFSYIDESNVMTGEEFEKLRESLRRLAEERNIEFVSSLPGNCELPKCGQKRSQIAVIGAAMPLGQSIMKSFMENLDTICVEPCDSRGNVAITRNGDYFFGNLQEMGMKDWKRGKMKIIKGRKGRKSES